MDLSGVLLPTDRDMGLSASPPGGGWPEAAWTHSYLPEPTSSADRQQAGGSPSGSCHRQPQHYSDYTDMGGGSGGWGSQGADPARPSAARRVLCRSQSEAGGSSARMSVDSPPAADIAAAATSCYPPSKTTAGAAVFSSAADLRLSAAVTSFHNGQSGYEGTTAQVAPHLYHARSDIQHCESSAASTLSRSPPPPLLHSTSLSDTNGRIVGAGGGPQADYFGSKLAASRSSADMLQLHGSAPNSGGRSSRPSDLCVPSQTGRPYMPSFSGLLRSAEGLVHHQGSGDMMPKRGRGIGGGGGVALPESGDSCSHCGVRHGAGGCPLAERGYPEKVSLILLV